MEELLKLQVTGIKRETDDTITVQLKPVDQKDIVYWPGQFLTFIFERRGRELRRSFSLSSSPDIDSELAITVKRVVNGEISTWLYNHLRVGDVLTALPPAGRFTLDMDEVQQRDIFFIAAGSGITPVYSILKSVLRKEPRSHITLIYSSRSELSTIFYTQLNALERQYPEQFRCIYVFSDAQDKSYPYRAHLNLGLLETLIQENLRFAAEKAVFYLCGPFVYMRMADMMIVAMGFPKDHIYKENFVVLAEQEAIQSSPVTDRSDKQVSITYRGTTYDLTVPYGKNILKAALEHGIALPYSCQGGVCGNCTAVCTEGIVQMSINEVLTNREMQKGMVLTCTGFPATPVVKLEIK